MYWIRLGQFFNGRLSSTHQSVNDLFENGLPTWVKANNFCIKHAIRRAECLVSNQQLRKLNGDVILISGPDFYLTIFHRNQCPYTIPFELKNIIVAGGWFFS